MWKCPHSTYYLNICCENKIKAMGWTVLGGKFQYQRDMKSCSSEANIKYVVRDEIYISNLIWGKYQISSEIYIYLFFKLEANIKYDVGEEIYISNLRQIWSRCIKRYVSLFHNVIIRIDSGRVAESFNLLMIRRTFQARTNLPGLPSLIQSSFIRLHFVPVTHSIKQPSETGICQNFRFSSVQFENWVDTICASRNNLEVQYQTEKSSQE